MKTKLKKNQFFQKNENSWKKFVLQPKWSEILFFDDICIRYNCKTFPVDCKDKDGKELTADNNDDFKKATDLEQTGWIKFETKFVGN